jgi:hypothetical protein
MKDVVGAKVRQRLHDFEYGNLGPSKAPMLVEIIL